MVASVEEAVDDVESVLVRVSLPVVVPVREGVEDPVAVGLAVPVALRVPRAVLVAVADWLAVAVEMALVLPV